MDYWIIKLGTVKGLFLVIGFIMVIGLFLSYGMAIIEKEEIVSWKKWIKTIYVLIIVFLVIGIFIPKEREILIVYGVEEIYDYMDVVRNFLRKF